MIPSHELLLVLAINVAGLVLLAGIRWKTL